MQCKKFCSEELRCSNFGLTHPEPDLFVSPQGSCCPRLVYVIYRILAFAYFFTWLIVSAVTYPESWYIFLTNWGFSMLTLSLLVQAVLVSIAYYKERKRHGDASHVFPEMTWYLKAGWVMHNISATISLTITLAYWTLLFSPSFGLDMIDFTTHASNSMMVLVDLFVTGIPHRVYHMVHPVLAGAVYLLFSVAYTLVEGSYIYDIIDWNNDPGSAALYSLVILLVVVPVIWLILYGLYRLRLVIYKACPCGGQELSHHGGRDTELHKPNGIDNMGMEI